VKVEAPPNIAFIKYWGKLEAASDDDRNLATNPSISMTLANAKTTTIATPLASGKSRDLVYINNRDASDKDGDKVSDHLDRVAYRVLAGDAAKRPRLKIDSSNNFPAGAGIASSASAFAALTLAAIGAFLGQDEAERYLLEQPDVVSELARRGSGSAARSIDGFYMKWDGRFARRFECQWRLKDTIVLLSRQHKSVPSSDGHKLAQSSPLFAARLKQLPTRLAAVEAALKTKDLSALGPLLEAEALELHEIARTGTPSVDYLLPETRALVELMGQTKQRDFYFTIDAGPNLHILSERNVSSDLQKLAQRAGLPPLDLWEDEAGHGPSLG